MSYTDIDRVQSYLGRELTEDEVLTAEMLIEAATRFIQQYTHRTFVVDTADTVKYYDGGTNEIVIDNLTTLTSVVHVDETGTTQNTYVRNTDYYTLPRSGSPILSIYSAVGNFPHGVENIKVTGKFGEALPEPIRSVATKIVALSLNDELSKKSESIEGYSVVFADRMNDWSIQSVLDSYRRIII